MIMYHVSNALSFIRDSVIKIMFCRSGTRYLVNNMQYLQSTTPVNTDVLLKHTIVLCNAHSLFSFVNECLFNFFLCFNVKNILFINKS